MTRSSNKTTSLENYCNDDINRQSIDEAVNRFLTGLDNSTTGTSNWQDCTDKENDTFSRTANNVSLFDATEIFPPAAPQIPRKSSLIALQEWEGYVVEVEKDNFVARLIDLTAGNSYESEEATIPLAELSDYDRENLMLGGIFRWVIGYECSPKGTRKRVSQIVFRDLPRITECDIQRGKKWADEIFDLFSADIR